MPNYLSTGQKIGYALSALGNMYSPNASALNMALLGQMQARSDQEVAQRDQEAKDMAARNLLAAPDKSFALQQPAKFIAGADYSDTPDTSSFGQGGIAAAAAALGQPSRPAQDTIIPAAPPITGNLLSGPNRDSLMATALGPQNLLQMKIAQATPKYENVPDVGLVNVNALGGPKTVISAIKQPLSDVGKAKADLDAGRITPAQFSALVAKETRDPAQERVTFKPMTPDQIKQWGLPEGTVAVMGSNGKPEVVSKASTQDWLDGVPDGLAGEDAVKWVSQNLPGGASAASQAQMVVQGKMKLPPQGRPGSIGERVNSIISRFYPGFDAPNLNARFQLNQELNNQGDKALGGKLNSVGKIVNHSVGLLGSAIDLDNPTNWTPANAIVNQAKSLHSNDAIAAFKKNQEGLGAEFEKFSGGGTAGQEMRKEAAGSYSPNQGMPGTIGAVGKTIEMMEGQLEPVVANWNRVYGTNYDTDEFIRTVMNNPKTADQLAAMKQVVSSYRMTKQVDVPALKALTGRGAAPQAAPQTAQVVIQNGWRYDAKTHQPIGPAQQ